MDDVLLKLIEFVENASPTVWEIVLRQVYVDAYADLVWVIILVVLCIAFGIGAKVCCKMYKEDGGHASDWMPGIVFSIAFSFVAGLIACMVLTGVLKYFANPEFYAIQLILEQIR